MHNQIFSQLAASSARIPELYGNQHGIRTVSEENKLEHGVTEVFLVMQGGGAKGIAHAGGLIAIEEQELSIKGIAGTSAGSIVAALVAAGYRGRELADPATEKHIFDWPPFGKKKSDLQYSKPTHLFTWFGWKLLFTLRMFALIVKALIFPSRNRVFVFIYWFSILAVFMAVTGWMAFFAPQALYDVGHWIYEKFTSAALKLLGCVVVALIWGFWGLTSVRNIRLVIDSILAKKLKSRLNEAGIAKNRDITFDDLHAIGCPPLKIIATNTATESLELFCRERTPDVAIADAVAASICLPLIFKPKRLTFTRKTPFGEQTLKGKFLDGGIVSNLPAWALDEERLLYPNVPTIALSLSAPTVVNTKPWFSALLGTVVNGSSEIHTRTTGQILTIPLKTTANMLDFDLPASKVFTEVENARQRVMGELSDVLQIPVTLHNAAKDLHAELQALLDRFAPSICVPGPNDRLRVAIAVQRGSSMKSISSVANHGYTLEDSDGLVTVPIADSHAGMAWMTGEIVVDEIVGGAAKRLQLHDNAWSQMTWIHCFPVRFEAENGQKARPFVIVVDSNITLDRTKPNFDRNFKKLQTFLGYAVERYTRKTNLAKYAQGANTWF